MHGHINAIGLEVEGPFKEPVPIEGYVKEFKDEILPQVAEPCLLKECVSGLLKNNEAIDSFFAAIQPRLIEKLIVPGMGLHMHFSFKQPRFYQLLYSKLFVERYLEELFTHFKHDKALLARPSHRSQAGSNFYRMDYPESYFLHHIPRRNHKDNPKERYYVINFQRAFGDHETFEMRIFPTTTITRMREYIQFTIDYINAYIERHLGEEELEFEFSAGCDNTEEVLRTPNRPTTEGEIILQDDSIRQPIKQIKEKDPSEWDMFQSYKNYKYE